MCALADEQIAIQNSIRSVEDPEDRSIVQAYRDLLSTFGYFDGSALLSLKGKVAIALHIDDPLPAVELLFAGFFTGLSAPEIVAATSAFVESPPKFKRALDPSVGALWASMKRTLAPFVDAVRSRGLPKPPLPKKRLLLFTYAFLARRSVADAAAIVPGLTEGAAVRILKRIRELLARFSASAESMGVSSLSFQFHAAQTLFTDNSTFDNSLFRTTQV
jgi:superfamily II RNA helicase